MNFEKERRVREAACIERLIDIRTLQVAYKSEYDEYTDSMDSLINFFNEGSITIIRQVGSLDDSAAVAEGRVYRDSIRIAVKDTLFKRAGFSIDSLRYIPYSGGREMEMLALVKKVSGVDVALFEAGALFDDLLLGLDRQLIVNLNAERKDTGRYPGLRVGSIDSPNNNAGNWE